MSHRDTCPSRWEAEREGERAQEHGYGRFRNPYDEHYGNDRACEEASEAWRDGYRRAECREEEQREEEAAQARAARHRAELQAEEDYAYQQAEAYAQEQQYYEERDRAQWEAEQAESVDAVGQTSENPT